MLYARALSNGARWFCPDVLNGSPIYTPEELGANVNEDGEVIDLPATDIKSDPNSVTPPAQKQLSAIHAAIGEISELAAIDKTQLEKDYKAQLGIESWKDLTVGQATNFIKQLQEHKKVAEQKKKMEVETEPEGLVQDEKPKTEV